MTYSLAVTLYCVCTAGLMLALLAALAWMVWKWR